MGVRVSAETLLKAAALMRSAPDGTEDLSMAGWLEEAAAERCGCYIAGSLTDDCGVLVDGCSIHARPLNIARTYLRLASRG